MNSIPIKNVYHMLVYAFEILKSKEYERLDNEKFENVYDLLASLLLCGMNTLIKRGFLKNYTNQSEELNAIRGRINIDQSIRKLSFQNAKVVCNFDEFNNNIYFNQVLKTTFLYLQRCSLQKKIKHAVTKVLIYFNEVDTIRISSINWDNFIFNRNNAYYDILLYFCKLIFEESIANQRRGGKEFVTIEDRFLPSLFERFVYAFYKKHLMLPYKVMFQQKIEWNVNKQDMLPKMYADTIIENSSEKLIIDTKFYSRTVQSHYRSDNQKIISENLYQIFAYVKNEAVNTSSKLVSGMLLYPQVDIALKKSYFIDGHNFYIYTIDLDQDFELIKQELLDVFRTRSLFMQN